MFCIIIIQKGFGVGVTPLLPFHLLSQDKELVGVVFSLSLSLLSTVLLLCHHCDAIHLSQAFVCRIIFENDYPPRHKEYDRADWRCVPLWRRKQVVGNEISVYKCYVISLKSIS